MPGEGRLAIADDPDKWAGPGDASGELDDDPSGGLRDQLSAEELNWLLDRGDEPDGPDPDLCPDAYPDVGGAPAWPDDPGARARALVSALSPGSALAALLEDTVPGRMDDGPLAESLPAWRRIASWAAAGELAATAELARRRTPRLWDHPDENGAGTPDERQGIGSEPIMVSREAVEEVALALTLTRWSADIHTNLAVSFTHRLPDTLTALRRGRVDLPRARLFDEATSLLSVEDAQRVEGKVLPRAARMTTGELRDALRRAVISVDPAAAEKRRKRAERDARVTLYGDSEHTATLAGEKLPAACAAAAYARIAAIAAAMRAAGVPGGAELLKAKVFAGLLLGTLPDVPPSHPSPDDPGPGGAGPGDMGLDEAGPGDIGPGDIGPDEAGPGDPGPGEPGPGEPGPGDMGLDEAGPGDPGLKDAGLDDMGPGDMGPDEAGPGDMGAGGAGRTDPGQGGPGPGDHGAGGSGLSRARRNRPRAGCAEGRETQGSARPGRTDSASAGPPRSRGAGPGSMQPVDRRRDPEDAPEPDAPATHSADPLATWPALPAPGTGTAPGCAKIPATVRFPAGRLRLAVPWRTLATIAAEPGKACWLGPVTPETAREICAAGAADSASVWKVIITDDEGRAIAATRVKRRHIRERARGPDRYGGMSRVLGRDNWADMAGRPDAPETGGPNAESPTAGTPTLVREVTLTLPLAVIREFAGTSGERLRTLMRSAKVNDARRSEHLGNVLAAAVHAATAKLGTEVTKLASAVKIAPDHGSLPVSRPAVPLAGPTTPAALAEAAAGWPAMPENCAHTDEVPGYRVPRSMRDFLQARDVTCRFAVCRQPASRCDADHSIPYHRGGRTCRCNLGSKCRTHHQLKQLPGWSLEQPSPGVFMWRTPSGVTYAVTPDHHPV